MRYKRQTSPNPPPAAKTFSRTSDPFEAKNAVSLAPVKRDTSRIASNHSGDSPGEIMGLATRAHPFYGGFFSFSPRVDP